jgi:hypothetical protein
MESPAIYVGIFIDPLGLERRITSARTLKSGKICRWVIHWANGTSRKFARMKNLLAAEWYW